MRWWQFLEACGDISRLVAICKSERYSLLARHMYCWEKRKMGDAIKGEISLAERWGWRKRDTER